MIIISYNVLQKRLIFQKYKKCSPGKYDMLLYVAVSIRWISIRLDAILFSMVEAAKPLPIHSLLAYIR